MAEASGELNAGKSPRIREIDVENRFNLSCVYSFGEEAEIHEIFGENGEIFNFPWRFYQKISKYALNVQQFLHFLLCFLMQNIH